MDVLARKIVESNQPENEKTHRMKALVLQYFNDLCGYNRNTFDIIHKLPDWAYVLVMCQYTHDVASCFAEAVDKMMRIDIN
jgi:hypothetical protein